MISVQYWCDWYLVKFLVYKAKYEATQKESVAKPLAFGASTSELFYIFILYKLQLIHWQQLRAFHRRTPGWSRWLRKGKRRKAYLRPTVRMTTPLKNLNSISSILGCGDRILQILFSGGGWVYYFSFLKCSNLFSCRFKLNGLLSVLCRVTILLYQRPPVLLNGPSPFLHALMTLGGDRWRKQNLVGFKNFVLDIWMAV